MKKEIIPIRQGIYIIIMFFTGSFVLVGTNIQAKQDVWLSVILTTIVSIPILFVYSKLLTTFPGKNIHEIFVEVFGKIAGRIISLLFIWYTFHLGSLVIRNYSEYVNIVAFPETPQTVSVFLIGLLCIWMSKAGVEVLGRWASFTAPFILAILVVAICLSLTNADYENIKPILYNGISPVISTSVSFLSFPFLEVVIYTAIFNTLNDNKKTFKVFFISAIIGSIILLLVLMRNILVLGSNIINDTFFPAILAVEVINIGVFIQRIEVVVSIVFILGAYVRISSCLLATSVGVATVLDIDNKNYLIAPLGFLMMCISILVYNSTMEMFEWLRKYYTYYAFPFQIGLPVITLIVAKIKMKFQKNKQKEGIKISEPQTQ
ncbi:endospore germination permease [Ruminiclostridium herbifermentans]|uniref:Endospore germination permease n=1 Tax=Ruminiclostridium herbifermentans TaxID=2488810 RepID=A0A7H1VKR2_9FIRM|nr:endospore germination permease [Ruminiclostridium herbifermentans]QNU65974.1 endospore germination permease [Ruminiclostridium herbifermentans]